MLEEEYHEESAYEVKIIATYLKGFSK